MRKGIKVMLIVLSAALAVIIVLLAVLFFLSPGKPGSIHDANGNILAQSISEKTFVNIGGVRQGMFIRGRNFNNPVLLYLHGGPAFPNYFLIDKFQPGLEDIFTVCYWEQRGGGLSYTPDVTPESMTFEQFASDAIEVTNYLRQRFGKEKIFLMAHSGGTPIALLAATRAPHLYYAYIGMAQITNQRESEKIAYKYMLGKYSSAGNSRKAEEFRKFPVLESDRFISPFYQSLIRDESMHELGIGTMHSMTSVFWDIFIPVWTCRAYTLKEKINIWSSKFSFIKRTGIIEQLLSTDFAAMAPKLDVPVYFFSGKYDMTVNIDLSKAYLKKLKAPVKGFYTFEHSAHSPLFEEPQKVKAIITRDVLNLRTDLCDKELTN